MESTTVTVLSAELPGFAELAGSLPAKEFNALLPEIHELTEAAIRLHQGVLTSFSGDLFQSVFFAAKSIANPLSLAMEALIELRERLETSLEEKSLPVEIRFKAGIAFGEATVGEFESGGEKQITVMGPAVNFSNRLREFAEP